MDQDKPSLYDNATFLDIVRAMDATNYGVTGLNYTSEQIISAMKQSLEAANDPFSAWKAFLGRMDGKLKDANGVDIPSTVLKTGINIFGTSPNLKNFFTDLAFGRTHYLHGRYVVRHTTLAPSTYGANVADFNVEKIYSIAGLISECQNGSLWILPMPGYLAYKIANYPVPSPTDMLPNYMFGALKMRSDATLAARNRIEIKTEYIIDAAPIHTYGLAT